MIELKITSETAGEAIAELRSLAQALSGGVALAALTGEPGTTTADPTAAIHAASQAAGNTPIVAEKPARKPRANGKAAEPAPAPEAPAITATPEDRRDPAAEAQDAADEKAESEDLKVVATDTLAVARQLASEWLELVGPARIQALAKEHLGVDKFAALTEADAPRACAIMRVQIVKAQAEADAAAAAQPEQKDAF